MSAFTKCFRPVSSYPSDFADLVVWLRADSGVTFDIPTKRVSAWADKSGNSNDVAQATVANQPLREGYGGQNDKAYFSFDGTNDLITSSNNSPIATNFTIFEVSKIDEVSNNVFGWNSGDASISIGTDASGYMSTTVNDGVTSLSTNTAVVSTLSSHISVLKKDNKRIDLEYYDSANSITTTDNDSGFNHSFEFNTATFDVGSVSTSNFLNGQLQEVIIYNRALSTTEIADVRGYLNLKYKIY